MLYQNRYRIESTRLQGYDYQSIGMYFVTICTDQKQDIFGMIQNGMMCLSQIGQIAYACWIDIPKHFTHVTLDTFVIMPNHMHGIIVIGSDDNNTVFVETRDLASLQSNVKRKFGPLQKRSLSSIIQSYKSSITRICRKNDFGYTIWQSNYHDRIIRTPNELDRIRQYILHNPKKYFYG